jgi:hypothetical protein
MTAFYLPWINRMMHSTALRRPARGSVAQPIKLPRKRTRGCPGEARTNLG